MRINRYKTSVVRSAVPVLALVLAGCSGAAEDGGDSDKTLMLGISTPLSGPIGAAGTAQSCGVKAYFEAKNAAGGVNGYTVKFREEDNQGDPATAATIARDFANEEVFAAFLSSTPATDASFPALNAANIPVFSSADGSLFSPPKAPANFGIAPKNQDELKGGIQFITDELRASSISYVNMAGVMPAASEAFPGIVADQGGQVGTQIEIKVGTTDFSPIAQKLKEANAPVVYAQLTDTLAAPLQKAAAAIGYEPKWVLYAYAYGPTYLQLAGSLADDVYISRWLYPTSVTDRPAIKQFVKDVEALGGDCAQRVSDTSVGIGYTVGAVIGRALEAATKDGEAPTADAMVAALSFEEQAVGIAESLSFTDESHAGISAASYWQIKGDDLEQVSDWISLR
jgi:branched-chain amino acid transport system substrate-binding protein